MEERERNVTVPEVGSASIELPKILNPTQSKMGVFFPRQIQEVFRLQSCVDRLHGPLGRR